MNWIKRKNIYILEEDDNYEVVGSPMYIGMYAAYFQGKLIDNFYTLSAAKERAETHYKQKELDRQS